MGGIGFDGKFLKKIVESGGGRRGGVDPQPHYGKPWSGMSGKVREFARGSGEKNFIHANL